MAKDDKRRKLNQQLKRAGIGIKWQRHFESQAEHAEAVKEFTSKKK